MHASRSQPDHAETRALFARLRFALEYDSVQAQRIVDRLTSSHTAETVAAHRRLLKQLRLRQAESGRQDRPDTPFGRPAPRLALVQRPHDGRLHEPERAA